MLEPTNYETDYSSNGNGNIICVPNINIRDTVLFIHLIYLAILGSLNLYRPFYLNVATLEHGGIIKTGER